MEAIGAVIQFLESEQPVTDNPEKFLSLLIRSAEPTEPWLSRNQYDALKTSGVYHYISASETANTIANVYESHDVLFNQANAMDGGYGSFVMQLIPADYQSSLSVLKGYVDRGRQAPTIPDPIAPEQAVLKLLEQRSKIVALARSEAAVLTGKWYALTRMEGDFVDLRQELIEYLEAQNASSDLASRTGE